MGDLNISAYRDPEHLRRFTKALLRDLQALQKMLDDDLFENDIQRIGAEQELFIVDASMKPINLGAQLLEMIDDEHFTPELAQFNLECNLDPLELRAKCFSELHRQTDELVAKAKTEAQKLNADVVLAGILPTLAMEDITLDSMSANPRYHALNDALAQLRGGDFQLRLKGVDDLIINHNNIMLESCNTSFQVHLQVSAHEFAKMYNVAQVVAAPVMACAANSPLLFGKRLWKETRLALFQQSVDTRRSETPQREIMARVSFGTSWVKESVTELYKEDIARFRTLIATEQYSDPFAALKDGRTPSLNALCLHTGTVYRWNRACYGVGNGKPHLRIENRLLPAGPSTIDEVANAAFWIGLMRGVADQYGDPQHIFNFDDAKSNLLSAARLGLDAQIIWLDGNTYPVHDLVLNLLIPIARIGLELSKVDKDDIDLYLGIIESRVRSNTSGAKWMLDSAKEMRVEHGVAETLTALVASTIENQNTGKPIHQWPLAEVSEQNVSLAKQFEYVASLMGTDLFTVRETELVDLAANMMDWWHLRHIPVEDDDHQLVGLLTARTLMRSVFSRQDFDSQLAVKEIMDCEPISVRPETTTLEAIALMRREKISCLPVTDEANRLVGMVTEDRLMNIAARLLEQELSSK
ncbi:MAG: CBS domain-containing protein/gamma-glutamyl:cysteine ligase YbdK (ATP-grasp superfamily) [Myxococcota bacterium]|jgi:CBS domain-containing protein/gamma-glutamyl:cysteine ligase YbdK (ATP-grasp superfamily)